jgi:hypothetical protein
MMTNEARAFWKKRLALSEKGWNGRSLSSQIASETHYVPFILLQTLMDRGCTVSPVAVE